MNVSPFPIVISAPSGTGKTTICREIVKKHPQIRYSVSVTTRPPRPDEVDGRDYFFLSPSAFQEKVAKGELVEWALVHDHYYGTPREFLEQSLKEGFHVILDLDVQGGMRLKELYPEGVFIFVLPPSFADLRERLKKRGTEKDEVLKKRLEGALEELKFLKDYSYVVINESLKKAVRDIEAIITAEECRVSHWRPLENLERGESH